MPRQRLTAYAPSATPKPPSLYTLTEPMLAAIRERGSSDTPTIRALADEFHVPFYWMKEQVLAHGPGVDHTRILRKLDEEAQAFVREAQLTPVVAPSPAQVSPAAPQEPIEQPAPQPTRKWRVKVREGVEPLHPTTQVDAPATEPITVPVTEPPVEPVTDPVAITTATTTSGEPNGDDGPFQLHVTLSFERAPRLEQVLPQLASATIAALHPLLISVLTAVVGALEQQSR